MQFFFVSFHNPVEISIKWAFVKKKNIFFGFSLEIQKKAIPLHRF